MLGLKSIHVSEMGPRYQLIVLTTIWTDKEITRDIANTDNKVIGIRCLPGNSHTKADFNIFLVFYHIVCSESLYHIHMSIHSFKIYLPTENHLILSNIVYVLVYKFR